MSRFFATASDSESESGEEEVQQPTYGRAAAFTFSDDEEEVKRVVRSTKEKRYENLTTIIKNIRNHKKIKDMSSILSSFEELTRAYQKALPVIMKEESGITPRFYVRCLAELEDFINEVWEDREGRKNMSKNNSKPLGTLRQKVRKYIKEFEEDLTKFREAPDQESEAEEEEGDSDNEKQDHEAEETARESKPTQQDMKSMKSQFLKSAADDGEDTDDSIDWGPDDDSESESSDEDNQYTVMRDHYLRRDKEKDEDREKRKKRETC